PHARRPCSALRAPPHRQRRLGSRAEAVPNGRRPPRPSPCLAAGSATGDIRVSFCPPFYCDVSLEFVASKCLFRGIAKYASTGTLSANLWERLWPLARGLRTYGRIKLHHARAVRFTLR